jgi:Ni/Fe-hydrogenase subunit HybB-like protein
MQLLQHPFAHFIRDCIREVTTGSKLYWTWMGVLAIVAIVGAGAYAAQVRYGLVVTGMSDQVSWGVYIANFTFLVGMAAAAVMLVIPAYIFHRKDAKSVVLLAEGVAVAACVMAMLFVLVDVGRPDRLWHMLPGLGRLNWPNSMLAWDVLVLNGYLLLNLLIPMYVLYHKYRGREPDIRSYFPYILLAIVWAVAIHTVTAFLYSSNVSRPFWHTGLLAPRFIASAFAAGPAFIILAFRVIDAKTDFKVNPKAIRLLALVTTVALQVNLFMLGAELFTEFYAPVKHAASAHYLFFGLHGHNALVPWIWSAIAMGITAVCILMVHRLRENPLWLSIACVLTIVGIWIEKGMGLIIPGFIPTPLGEIFEYAPSAPEVAVSLGIWSAGLMVFTVLAKAAIPIELGKLRIAHGRTATPVAGSNSAEVLP